MPEVSVGVECKCKLVQVLKKKSNRSLLLGGASVVLVSFGYSGENGVGTRLARLVVSL